MCWDFFLIWKTYQDLSIYWLFSPLNFNSHIFATKQNISINQREIWNLLSISGGGVQWLKPTTLKWEINQRQNFYSLIEKLLFFFFSLRNVLTWLGGESHEKRFIPKSPICSHLPVGDKLLFPQRLFDFFHHPLHFPAPHLGELLVALDVLT